MNTARMKPNPDTAAVTDVLPRPRAADLARLLVVNDDAAIRLKLADLLAEQYPEGRIDTCSETAAAAIGPVVRDYRGVLVVVDFAPAVPAGDPLAIVQHLRGASGTGTVVVIGRNGDERSALLALRAGASDYWPLHKVDAAELVEGLRAANGSAAAEAEPAALLASVPGFRTLKELRRASGTGLYLAESVESGEQLALKVHRHRSAAGASNTERVRFERECQLLSQFNDRGIAEVHGFGVTEGFYWLALEYFPAGSLKERLQNPVTEADTLHYMTSIATALASIHAAGIVHRDLKPSNIMLRADNSVALIDFGLARPVLEPSSLTLPNVRVGSPLYMAPEQIEGLTLDARCDLYALGVMFHELLTGRVPYPGDSIAAVLAQHRQKPTPQLPESLARFQALLNALMAKRPAERPESAAAVLDSLAALSGTRPWWKGA